MSSIEERILKLKNERKALILAHYYEDGEVQDIADAIGDSFFLAQEGKRSKAQTILLAGVVFMAESVKILSPEKRVLVPDLNAGCSLVDSSPFDKYLAWRRDHPEALAVTYINSSAAVKAISDVIITSSNAEKIIRSIPSDRKILFGPDRHLGHYLSQKLERPMELWPGSCQVHVLFSAKKLFEQRTAHPDALVLAHPECDAAVLEQAQVIGSTSKLLEEVKTNSKYKKFIVATETGIFHQMKKARQDVELIQAPTDTGCACNDCPFMKLNTLEKIERALETMKPEVQVPHTFMAAARVPLERMLQIAAGEAVEWPSRFQYP